jgi:hypothetical protein
MAGPLDFFNVRSCCGGFTGACVSESLLLLAMGRACAVTPLPTLSASRVSVCVGDRYQHRFDLLVRSASGDFALSQRLPDRLEAG